ncbi:MAG: BamA/TamA family outer membrane protein [Gemmatimonadaceae bacterium]
MQPRVLLLLLVGAASVAAAQDRGCTTRRPRVEGLAITGNRAIADADLRAMLYTERAGKLRRWFGWNVGPTACLDSLEVDRDTRRIAAWYAMRGYPGTTSRVTLDRTGASTVKVHFRVTEARPVRMDTVQLAGLPPRVVNQGALMASLRGKPMDDSLLVAVMDSVQQLLRAAGYARAQPPSREARVDSAARRARVTLHFAPGNLIHVGDIAVDLTANDPAHPALSTADIRTLLKFEPGDVYRASDVGASQQLLYSHDVYRTVAIDTVPSGARGDTIPVRVRLVEGRHSALRAGGGWGTIDCFRTQARYTQQNFLGRAHRLQLDGRLSKLGIGAPFDGFESACAAGVRADTFSTRLNYYVGATLQLRGVIGDVWHPQFTLYSEQRTEFQTYVRETAIGGLASVERPLIPRINTSFAYRFDAGRTISDQAVACAVFGLCRFDDRLLLQSPSVTHAAGVTLSRSAPALGVFAVNDERWAVETRLGTVRVGDPGQRINFNRTQLEFALYRPLTRGLIGAARVAGGIIATKQELAAFVPPQERFYSGGQNTVRGYGQGQLGPAVYIVRSISDTVIVGGEEVGFADPADGFDRLSPAGGTASALVNLELRTRGGWPTDILRWVVFLDAGRVWNASGNYAVTGLRATPGVGVRLVTPIGPFRVDVGYNPHGWEAGPAFYVQRATSGVPGRAICVSPGSREPLDAAASDALGPVPCPTSFQPPRRNGLLPRLQFHFSIGEAF